MNTRVIIFWGLVAMIITHLGISLFTLTNANPYDDPAGWSTLSLAFALIAVAIATNPWQEPEEEPVPAPEPPQPQVDLYTSPTEDKIAAMRQDLLNNS